MKSCFKCPAVGTGLYICCCDIFNSPNRNLPSKLNGNKFFWNLVVQQYLLTLFFKADQLCNRNKAWENLSMQLLDLFLVFSLLRLISSLAAKTSGCVQHWLRDCVSAAQYNGTPYLPHMGFFSSCYTLSVCKQWPFSTWNVTQGFGFGVASMLCISPELFLLLSWCFEAISVINDFQPSVHSLNFTKLKLPVQSLLCHFNDWSH